MSNGETPSEDRTILAAVEALEGTAPPAGASDREQTAETETLARLYTEVLGLIPFELEPITPSPQGRERLLALVQQKESRPVAEPAPAPAPPRASQEIPVPRPTPSPGRPAVAMARQPSRWPLALAAVLALVALGLSGWLYLQLSQERATVASLRRDLESERARVAAALAEARDLRVASGKGLADLRDLKEKLSLVTSRAALVAAMRPMGRPPLQPGAHGILFVAANHQHWYMSVEGLQPVEPGQTYKLWFVTAQGPVEAGTFIARPGAPIELTSKQMPTDTKGAVITLERDPNVAKPTGPGILRAAAMYQVS